MRALACILPVAVAGCDSAAPQYGAPRDEGNRIECRFGGLEQFERSCTWEREGDRGEIVVIRKPDGGFRRLRIVSDGRGVVAADGAEPARVTILTSDRIEVEIGSDRFRLPATMRR